MRKFTESLQNEIEFERIEDIGKELNEIEDYISSKLKSINDINNNLSRYKSKSRKNNDQIDDSVFTLQILKNDLETCLSNLDNIQSNLISYKENGRKKV
jgi:chromosome segregation ATPase|tara:strand:- start:12581 stop:12877 length:297 start_codon:yes stop_codon:yes gene_type:complete